MKKLMILPLLIMVCSFMIGCSAENDGHAAFKDETISNQEAQIRINEMAEDYGVKIKTKSSSEAMVWHESDLKFIESILKSFSKIKGKYQLRREKGKDGKYYLVQEKKISRITRISREEELSSEGNRGFSWSPSPDDNTSVYVGDFIFDCDFSALWIANKYGWVDWADVSGSINRRVGSGGADIENYIKEEGQGYSSEDWSPRGGGSIAFDGDVSYYVVAKNDWGDEYRVDLNLSYTGMCSIVKDSINGDYGTGYIDWYEKMY